MRFERQERALQAGDRDGAEDAAAQEIRHKVHLRLILLVVEEEQAPRLRTYAHSLEKRKAGELLL